MYPRETTKRNIFITLFWKICLTLKRQEIKVVRAKMSKKKKENINFTKGMILFLLIFALII